MEYIKNDPFPFHRHIKDREKKHKAKQKALQTIELKSAGFFVFNLVNFLSSLYQTYITVGILFGAFPPCFGK